SSTFSRPPLPPRQKTNRQSAQRQCAPRSIFVRTHRCGLLKSELMSDLVLTSRDGDVGILTVNNPPVNALSPGVPEGIAAGVEQFEKEDAIKAIVLIGGGRTFIAGADIREFGKMTSSAEGRRGPGFNAILDRIEKSSKPVVAAIHGTALGGGLETAMACHYRVAVPTAQVGQPEVKLGIIPGAGGTQR